MNVFCEIVIGAKRKDIKLLKTIFNIWLSHINAFYDFYS